MVFLVVVLCNDGGLIFLVWLFLSLSFVLSQATDQSISVGGLEIGARPVMVVWCRGGGLILNQVFLFYFILF